MNKLQKTVLGICCLCPTLALADDLNFTVTNLSKSIVTFGSTDLFDLGTDVFFNETRTHTYTSPPKNMRLSINNGHHLAFYVMTDPSCDALGFQALRQMTRLGSGNLTSTVSTYNAGNVHITISDMDGSTVYEKKITCSLSSS